MVSSFDFGETARVRVLVVEDEERLARLVAEGLSDEGVTVDIEHDGEAGLWRATETTYDVIVLDIMLPGMNGYQVCRELRRAGNWTPVLMLTAKDGEFDEAEALDTGADDFLRKPFSFVVLSARLRALVRRGAPERPVELALGDLRFDPATRMVTRAETCLDLTNRELAILEMLLQAKGDPVSRRDIIDRVWGLDAPTSNAVDVHVRTLRQKVDGPHEHKMIATVRGFGFQLIGRT